MLLPPFPIVTNVICSRLLLLLLYIFFFIITFLFFFFFIFFSFSLPPSSPHGRRCCSPSSSSEEEEGEGTGVAARGAILFPWAPAGCGFTFLRIWGIGVGLLLHGLVGRRLGSTSCILVTWAVAGGLGFGCACIGGDVGNFVCGWVVERGEWGIHK